MTANVSASSALTSCSSFVRSDAAVGTGGFLDLVERGKNRTKFKVKAKIGPCCSPRFGVAIDLPAPL
jgi:hypothetical protein